jgi:predicted N-formylglutamate amidohydrolase
MASLAPFSAIAGPANAGVLILCDHAGRAIPDDYGGLGLPPSVFERHIAYDIGAAGVTDALAAALGAPALLANFSRLLIDTNRGADDPTLVMRLSDGALVPGNARIGDDEIERRLAMWWRPYQDAIGAQIEAMLAAGPPPVIVSMHSFTPAWKGVPRPWHVGILWDRDARLARPLIDALAAQPDLVVGDNEPYDGALAGDTMYRHGTGRGLAHALVEIRQDLIAEPAAQRDWGQRLAALLRPIVAEPSLHEIVFHGSRAD